MNLAGGSGGTTVAPFDAAVTVNTTTTLGSGGTADWWGRSYTVRRPSDNALVCVYRRGTHHDSTSSTALHIIFNDDPNADPAAWTAEDTDLASAAVSGFPLNPPTNTISYGEGMPLVAPNGDLVILMWRVDGNSSSGTPKGTWQARSTDGGSTWTQEGQVTSWGHSLNVDKTFATDDWFTHPNGTTYTCGRVYNAVPTTDSYVILVSNPTRDLAVGSWGWVADITSAGSDTQESALEYLGNGRMIAMIRSLNNNVTRQGDSDDDGLTWNLTDVSSTVQVSGRHKIYTRMHLQGEAGWWKDPVLIMSGFQLMSPGSSQQRRNCVWVSPDRGATWEGPFYLDTQTEDAGYGDIWYNADGTYSAVMYDGALTAASLKQYDITIDFV